MSLQPTERLYLQDDHCLETMAVALAVEAGAVACDRTCFYPGGGGQPCDTGLLVLPDGAALSVESVRVDESGVIWHVCRPAPPYDLAGQMVCLVLDAERRRALSHYHTVLHVLNTIALRDYGAWITGVQIGTDYSRIDFKWDGFSREVCGELEQKVNAVLAGDRAVTAREIPEDEFRRREDLLRTLEAKPPVIGGRVRVVAIEGFDEQACGGTHVARTSEVGRFTIYKTENKGKINKRMYVRLEGP